MRCFIGTAALAERSNDRWLVRESFPPTGRPSRRFLLALQPLSRLPGSASIAEDPSSARQNLSRMSEGRMNRPLRRSNATQARYGGPLHPRRSGLSMGTTCTVTSRTSERKRLMTEPSRKISQRERTDWPKTTWEMLSC